MGITRSEKSGERTPLTLAAGAAAVLAVAGCADGEGSKLAQARAALSIETAQKIAVVIVTGQDPSDEFITLQKECSVEETGVDGVDINVVCTSPINLDKAEEWPENPYQGRSGIHKNFGPYDITMVNPEYGLPGKIVVRVKNKKVFQLDETNGLPAGLKGSLLLEEGVSFTENPRILIQGGGAGAPIKTVFNTTFDANGQLQNITLDGQWDITPDIPFAKDTFSVGEELFYKGQLFILIHSYGNPSSQFLKYTKSDKTGKWEKAEEFTYPTWAIPHYLANFSIANYTGDAIAITKGKNIKVYKATDFETGNFNPIAEFDCEVTNQHLGMHPKGWLVGNGDEGLVLFDPKNPGKMIHVPDAGGGDVSNEYEFKFSKSGKIVFKHSVVTFLLENPFEGDLQNPQVKITQIWLGSGSKSLSTGDYDNDEILDYDEPDAWTIPKAPDPPEPAPEPIEQPDAGSASDETGPDATSADPDSSEDPDATSSGDETTDGAFADVYNEITAPEDTSEDTAVNSAEDAPKVEDNGSPDEGPKPDVEEDVEGKDAQPLDTESDTGNPDTQAPDATKDTKDTESDTSLSPDTKPQKDQNGSPVEPEVAPIPEQTPGNDATTGEKDTSQNPPPAGSPANAESGGCSAPNQQKSRRLGEFLAAIIAFATLQKLRKKNGQNKIRNEIPSISPS